MIWLLGNALCESEGQRRNENEEKSHEGMPGLRITWVERRLQSSAWILKMQLEYQGDGHDRNRAEAPG